MSSEYTKLNPSALGIAFGIVWAGAVGILGIASRTGWGSRLQEIGEDLYIGFDDTPRGIVIGALWGFVDGLVCGVMVGQIYNAIDQQS